MSRALPRLLPLALCALAAATAAAAGDDELEVLPVQGNVYMIAGGGGNSTVQIGPEAVVVVDTKTGEVADRMIEAIRKLSSKPIRHIIVTSADPDHVGGNEQVSKAGTYVRLLDTFDPRGADKRASIIAHVNVLERMSGPSGSKTAAPPDAWPSDTYFTNSWALFVNDEAIELVHIPAAHTDGDTMAFFRRSDVIATGDIFTTTGYPRFDPERGGSVAGILDGLNRILEIAIPGENQTGGTAIVPGHGRISDETDVANYRDMVTIVRDRVAALIAAGKTLEQVQAARPSSDYDGIYAGLGGVTAQEFVAALYRELAGAKP
ncbi:MAG TPA: MBL fold metallo-hydrolase [Gammaproteobacteria bacterium]|nr:MBL fold metallo-hydrolase [Gammaproteobacteria bacterium]